MSDIIDILHNYGDLYSGKDILPEQHIMERPDMSEITPMEKKVIPVTDVTPKVNNGDYLLTDPSVSTFYSTKPQLATTAIDRDHGYRNNNPGNLTGSDGNFRKFNSLEEGWAALNNDLNIKISGKSKVISPDASVQSFINVYAPPVENDTVGYVNFIAKETGIDVNTPINKLTAAQKQSLLKNIVKMESPNSYVYLFDRAKYRDVMSNLNPQHVTKGSGILYNK